MKTILKLFVLLLISFSLPAQSNFYPEAVMNGPRTGYCGDYYLFTINDTTNNQFLIEAHEQGFGFNIFYDTITGLNNPKHVVISYFNGNINFAYTDLNNFGHKVDDNYYHIFIDTSFSFNNEISTVFYLFQSYSTSYFNVITFDSTNKMFYQQRGSFANYFGNMVDSFSVSSKKIEKVNNIEEWTFWQSYSDRIDQAVIAGRDSLNKVELFYLRTPLFDNDNTVKISKTVLFSEDVNTIHYASIADSILYFLSSDSGMVYAHSFLLNDSIFSIDTIGIFPAPVNISGNDMNEVYLFYPVLDSIGNALDSTTMITLNVDNWAASDTAVIPLNVDTATYVHPNIVFHHHDSTKQYLSTYDFTLNTVYTFYETSVSGYIQYSVNPWCVAGVDDEETKAYKIFPNPAVSILQLQLENVVAHENIEWQIFDLSGREAGSYSKIENDMLFINVEPLHSGLYISKLTINGKSFFDRFIKN